MCRQVVASCELTLSAAEFAVRWGEVFFATLDSSQGDRFRTLHQCELRSLRQTLRSLGCQEDCDRFVEELERYWRQPAIYTDAPTFFRANQLPTCCVSNADTEPLLNAIEKHALSFDAVVTSEQTRCYKPRSAIFHAGLDALGLRPDQVIHVGDSLHSDIGGAAALGIKTVWIQRDSRIHDIGIAKPDYTISELTELIAEPWRRLAG